jgi:DNA (cytosine-5)-methyltransferase 1
MSTAIELFSGCGGLTTGLEKAGFNVLSAIEIDPIASSTFSANHPQVHLINDDIKKVRASSLLRSNCLKVGELDLLAGCSPCQGFSTLRIKDSGCDDPRNQLVFEFLRLVKSLRPKTIFMENVPGIITTHYGMNIFSQLNRELMELGYSTDYRIIDTAYYGIPQFRKRFVLVGTRYKRHGIVLPDYTHSSPNNNGALDKPLWNTVRNAFNGVPHLDNGAQDPNIPLHKCSHNGELNMRRIKSVPHDGGSRTSFPSELVLDCHKKHPDGFKDVYGRMRWDKPSPTITSGCTNITRGRFIHPEEDRGISLYEASLLQTFPKDYVFHGNFSQKSLQIGNAVPVELAAIMGRQINDYLSTYLNNA